MNKILIAFVLAACWIAMFLAIGSNWPDDQCLYIGVGIAILYIYVACEFDKLHKDRRRWLHVKYTTTAIRNRITNEKEECTPDQFEKAVDRMIEASDEEYKKLK